MKSRLMAAAVLVMTVHSPAHAVGLIDECQAADVNGDCLVNVSDLLVVIAAWGPCPDPNRCPADIDGSGTVDVSDLLAVINNWD